MGLIEDRLKDSEREVLEAALHELGLLLEQIAASSHAGEPPDWNIQHIFVLFEEALETRAEGIVLTRSGGQLSCAGVVLDNSEGLAQSLEDISVCKLRIEADLTDTDLLRFVRVLTSPRRHNHPEHHPASFWYEQGNTGVALLETELPATDSTPHTDFQWLLEASRGGAHDSTRLLNLDARVAEKAPLPPRYDATLAERVRAHYSGILDETPERIRKRFGLSLMAAMGARKPALTGHEIAFISCKLLSEMFIAGEYENAYGLLMHLEFLISPGARLPKHTQEMASTALKHMCSNHMLMILAKTSEHHPDTLPAALVSWYMAGDPLVIWRAAAAHCGTEDLSALTTLFLHAHPVDEPFWEDALADLKPAQRIHVAAALGSPQDPTVHSRGPWTRRSTSHHEAPATPDPMEDSDDDILFGEPVWVEGEEEDEEDEEDDATPDAAHAEERSPGQSWGAFDLDAILINEPVWEQQQQWDTAFDAFLTSSDSNLPPDDFADSSILNSMIGHLNALEKSAIARTNFGRVSASQRGGRRRRRHRHDEPDGSR